jgi:hypothetical protein
MNVARMVLRRRRPAGGFALVQSEKSPARCRRHKKPASSLDRMMAAS